MKILITGATGFVGSHLTEALTEAGHELYSLARSENKFKKFDVKGKMISGSLHPYQKMEWIDELPSDLDQVIHTAGIVHSFDTQNFFKVNLEASKNLVDQLKEKYEKLDFIFISSVAAFGPSIYGDKVSESDDAKPVSDYGRSKFEAERALKEIIPENWSYAIIRPPMVIGPRDPAVLDVFKMVKSHLNIYMGLNGSKKVYSFVCVHDLVETICLLSKKIKELPRGDVFFSAHPDTIRLKDLIQKVKLETGSGFLLNLYIPLTLVKILSYLCLVVHKITKADIRLTPDKMNEFSPMVWACSSQKSRDVLGMDYKWDIDKTLKVTTKDYIERGWL